MLKGGAQTDSAAVNLWQAAPFPYCICVPLPFQSVWYLTAVALLWHLNNTQLLLTLWSGVVVPQRVGRHFWPRNLVFTSSVVLSCRHRNPSSTLGGCDVQMEQRQLRSFPWATCVSPFWHPEAVVPLVVPGCWAGCCGRLGYWPGAGGDRARKPRFFLLQAQPQQPRPYSTL